MVCRVFKKKCFFKIAGGGGGGEGSTSQSAEAGHGGGGHHQLAVTSPLAMASHYMHGMHQHPQYHQHQHSSFYYSQMQPPEAASYSHHVQVQDLLTNHRPAADAGYDFSGLPVEHPAAGLDVGSSDGGDGLVAEGRDHTTNGAAADEQQQWQASMDGFSNGGGGGASAAVQQMSALNGSGQRGGEMDLWGYGR